MATSSFTRPARRPRSLSFVIAALLLVGAEPEGERVGGVGVGHCWSPPVEGTVVDPFRPPPCPWCAGNRGIEYQTPNPTDVRSVAPGVVSFSGRVAGTLYVVVELRSGWRITYGRLASTVVDAGDQVLARTRIGTSRGRFFLGLRVGDTYQDPAPHLGQLVGTPRLVPLDGSTPRVAPPARLRCTRGDPPTTSANLQRANLQRV